MVRDIAGNSLAQARVLNPTATGISHAEAVSGTDVDFFRVSLSSRSSFTFTKTSSGANADVELIQDRNRNGRIDAGEIVASSRAPAGQSDRITITGLAQGTYFLRVFSKDGNVANYNFRLAVAPTTTVDFAYRVVELTNAFRQQNGLPPLAVNQQLSVAALQHSQAMAQRDFFSHTGADGSTPWQRMRNAGYNYRTAAENIAAGQKTPEAVVQGWINSAGHRANMLNPNLQEIGVGFFNLANDTGRVNYFNYWTQKFGTPA